MSWRDRDYAKWTEEERGRFLGSGVSAPRYAPQAGGSRIRPGAGLAILVSGLVFALGHFPAGHPIVPSLHFATPGRSQAPRIPSTGTISGPTSARFGSTLNLHGTAPPGNGPITIEGSYDGGQTWQTLSNVDSANGIYAAEISLNERGTLELRIVFADGSRAVGSINVD